MTTLKFQNLLANKLNQNLQITEESSPIEPFNADQIKRITFLFGFDSTVENKARRNDLKFVNYFAQVLRQYMDNELDVDDICMIIPGPYDCGVSDKKDKELLEKFLNEISKVEGAYVGLFLDMVFEESSPQRWY